MMIGLVCTLMATTSTSWAMSTLDVIKSNLMSICFPPFVQSYITLVYKECYDEARTFWDASTTNIRTTLAKN